MRVEGRGRIVDGLRPCVRAEQPEPDAGARADDRRKQKLPTHVPRDRLLHPDDEPGLPGPRREAPVNPLLEPAHVEEHVD